MVLKKEKFGKLGGKAAAHAVSQERDLVEPAIGRPSYYGVWRGASSGYSKRRLLSNLVRPRRSSNVFFFLGPVLGHFLMGV